jgi:NADH-quinone oxidoreductase subunit J
MTVEQAFFFIFATAAIISAILMILQRNPIMSAIYMIANFFCIAALYLLLQAQFLAVMQIAVYAGAIIVLVVFVIMLLNLSEQESTISRSRGKKTLLAVVASGFLVEMIYLFGSGGSAGGAYSQQGDTPSIGTIESIGRALFTRFLFPFEVISLILLAAIVGAVVLAKKQR